MNVFEMNWDLPLLFGNPTYTRTNFTKDEIVQIHLSVSNTFNIPKNQDV
jgi:hypothetical protein